MRIVTCTSLSAKIHSEGEEEEEEEDDGGKIKWRQERLNHLEAQSNNFLQLTQCPLKQQLQQAVSQAKPSGYSDESSQSQSLQPNVTAQANKLVPQATSCKTVRMTPLEELFADEDAVKMTSLQTSTSIQDRVEKELQMYKDMPPIITSDDPAAWWWNMRTTYPCLSDMAFSFLCVQASSTPSLLYTG
ncbi:hypothetical protein ABVT39_001585 [Epinephelus coioides]